MLPSRFLQYLAAICILPAAAGGAENPSDPAGRQGLVLRWDARSTVAGAASRALADGSDANNPGSLVGDAVIKTDPARVELGGKGAIVAQRPIRPERVTLEAVFRVDRTRGPLQLILTTHAPKVRPAADAEPGNSRQWFLQIRGEPQEDGYPGFLEFGIFGQDGRWHSLLSEMRITTGWHHAIGTFDGRELRLILDGQPQSRTRSGRPEPYEGPINQPPDALINLPAVGTNSTAVPGGLAGAVALASLYDRALGDDEIERSVREARRVVPELATQTVRSKAAKPPLKVLYSNDFTNTGITTPWHAKGEPFSPDHLRASVREAKGADAHLLQPAHGAVPWWPSKLYPLAEHHAWWAKNFGIEPEDLRLPGVHQYLLDGGDPFRDFLDECRREGHTPLISMRLNDTHHLHLAETPGNQQGIHSISRFYVEHPQWRLGDAGSGLDWSVPEVRQHMFGLIEEICENYPLAGLELDFMRFPAFFKDDVPVDRRIQVMTQFVADIRALLNRTAGAGPHRWLCARVPCMLGMHPEIGVDLPSLADAGVEMFNLSASYFTFQAHDLARIRRQVPDSALYLEMCHTTMTGERLTTTGGDNFLFLRTTDQQYYTTAHMAYRRGADGVSLFNFVYTREHGVAGRGPFHEPAFHVLRHLGDPDWLAAQPQWYFLAENWFTAETGQLPARLEKGDARTLRLDMAPTRHQKADGIFRLMAADDTSGSRWMVKVNGTTLTQCDYVGKPLVHPYESGLGEPSDYACFTCPRRLVHDGINKIALILEDGGPATVRYLDLVLP
ncbi:MAG: LamG-like jellyroll fold domain-containing protein [Thermoguttaceae bacterium]